MVEEKAWTMWLIALEPRVLAPRRVPGARLNTDAINTVQITYSKFEYDSALNPNWDEGRFELNLDSISVY